MRYYLIVFLVLVVFVITAPVYANTTITVDFLVDYFCIEPSLVITLEGRGISRDDQAAIFYMHDMAGERFQRSQVEQWWDEGLELSEIAWRLGVPPVIFPDQVFSWNRPDRTRDFNRPGRWPEEKVKQTDHSYEYKYEDRPAGIKETIEIKKDKYEFKYESRHETETLKVDLKKNTYEYSYRNRQTGENSKRKGSVVPFTSRNSRDYFVPKLVGEPSVRFNINFDWSFSF